MNEIINQINTTTIQLGAQLDLINDDLRLIGSALKDKSFFDSQLFAAIIGAVSALFFEKIIEFYRRKTEHLQKIYLELAHNGHWSSPESIYVEAKVINYEMVNNGEDKTLGEKMIIEFKKRIKYWGYRDFMLRYKFKKYEKALSEFVSYETEDKEAFKKNMTMANLAFKKIMDYVYRKTGESEWTIR